MSATETHDPMSPDAETAATTPDTAPKPPVGNKLKNGNLGGNPWSAPRCGARNRRGTPCRAAAMKDKKRCRHHGGASTGPRSAEGRAAVAAARTIHGGRSGDMRALLKGLRETGTAAVIAVADALSRYVAQAESGLPPWGWRVC